MAVQTTLVNKPLNPRGNDQSPLAYNRAKLFSGKALDFDGVNDKVEVADNANLSFGDGTTDSPFSITGYFNLDTLGANQTIAAKDNITNREYSLFVLTNNRLRFFIKNNGGGDQQSIDSDLVLESGKWYFVSATYDGRGGDTAYQGLSIYVNAQLTGVSTFIANSYTAMANTTAPFTAGTYSNNWMNGQLSNIKVFAGELTAAQVADLYNNPEKVVPTGVDNTALKLWLPMQEGAGTTAYNGAPDALGSELVTNGDFATDSDWIKGTGWSIANGKASKVAGSATELIQLSVFPSGFSSKTFKISFNLEVTAGSVRLRAGLNNQSYLNSSGSYVYCLTPTGNDQLKFGADSSFVGSIDNVSVQEVSGLGTISGATWTHGIGAPVAQTSVIDWNKWTLDGTNEVLVPQGLTSGRDLLGNLFENVRKQGALNLDGNSWAEVHDNASLDITDAITLECWINSTDKDQYHHIISKNKSDDANYAIVTEVTTGYLGFEIIGGQLKKTDYNVMDGNWNHVVVTYDETNLKFYVNGALDETIAYTSAIPTNSVDVYIGARPEGVQLYEADIAQPRIYNRALTAEEVQRNYNAGKNIYTNS